GMVLRLADHFLGARLASGSGGTPFCHGENQRQLSHCNLIGRQQPGVTTFAPSGCAAWTNPVSASKEPSPSTQTLEKSVRSPESPHPCAAIIFRILDRLLHHFSVFTQCPGRGLPPGYLLKSEVVISAMPS